MKFIVSIILYLTSTSLLAQDYFVKRISFDERINNGVEIKNHDGRIFIVVGHFCENLECSSLSELSMSGDTLWVTAIPDIDVGKSTFILVNDTLTISGNNDPFNSKFRMGHFNLEGEKLEETIEIEDPIEKFYNMFQLSTSNFENKRLIAGSGIQNDTMYGLIYIIGAQNELDTLMQLEPQDRRSVLWDIEINNNEELLTFHDIEEDGFGNWYKKINKFDKDYNLIWSYTSETSWDWESGSIGTELEDGRVLLIVYTPFGHRLDRSVRAINPDKSIDWQYNPDQSDEIHETVSNIKQVPSGDIIAMGRYTNMTLSDPIHSAPFLYKMTSDGEIIWKRVFYEIDLQTESTRTGFVRDVVELENGDIYGIGYMKYDDINNVFIFKIDENGCISSEDCGFVQVITNTGDIQVYDEVAIYPNPVSDVLTILSEDEIRSLNIYTLDGKLALSSDHTQEVDVSFLDKGIYFIRLRGKNQSTILRFVKD